MDQVNGEINPEPPPNFPAKRRRGRPRKDPSQGITRRVSANTPPRFDGFNGSKPLKLDAIEDTDNGIVGQPVTGVVEAAFDAGFMLSVRIGNSDTNLRGVVFKTGHYVPISAENDVAPHVQMIRRNEISLPVANQARTHGRHRRSRGRNARHVAELSAPVIPSMGSRGNVVPVLLQPMDVSNGVPLPDQIPQVYENGPFYQVGQKGNPMNQAGPSTALVIPQNEGAAAGRSSGDESDDVEEPLDVEPLQAIHTYVQNQSQPVKKLGRMTELLQAVQENVGGNQLLRPENVITRNDNAQI